MHCNVVFDYLIMTVSSYFWISEPAEVRVEVIFQSFSGAWERHTTEEEDDQHQVGECSSEVHHLQTQKCIQKVSYDFI